MKSKERCADCGIELRYPGESNPGFDPNGAPDGFWCDDCLEKIEIKHRWTGSVLFSAKTTNIRDALQQALRSGSDLRCSDLSGSDLSGSDLRGSNLRGSDLLSVRDDLWAVLSSAPAEVEGLRQALVDGKVNGRVYTGRCACLVGTIANIRGVDYLSLATLRPNSSRAAERFFLGIQEGDTPATNQFSELAVEWIDQWLSAIRSAFGSKT